MLHAPFSFPLYAHFTSLTALTDPEHLFCQLFFLSFSVLKKKAFLDGAYDGPRGFLQLTWPGSLADKCHNTTYCSRCVRWAAAAAECCGRTAPVYRVDGRVPVSATRRVPVSEGVVALRSRHVDFWVTFQVSSSRLSSSSSLLPRCVAVTIYICYTPPSLPSPSELTLPPATPTRPV
jgi:hypothetical protein